MIDIAVNLLALPVRILMWIFKHPRVLIFGAIIFFIVMGLGNCSKITDGKSESQTPQHYQKVTPDYADAPKIVSTATRIYYARDYVDDGTTVILYDYYYYDNSWECGTEPLYLDRTIYGNINIYDRKQE
jgi:hypothetical protein